MADQIKEIIAHLERQKAAIERALRALTDIEGTAQSLAKPAEPSAPAVERRPAKRQGSITPEGRRRLAEAMRKRWAAKRTAAQAKGRPAKRK